MNVASLPIILDCCTLAPPSLWAAASESPTHLWPLDRYDRDCLAAGYHPIPVTTATATVAAADDTIFIAGLPPPFGTFSSASKPPLARPTTRTAFPLSHFRPILITAMAGIVAGDITTPDNDCPSFRLFSTSRLSEFANCYYHHVPCCMGRRSWLAATKESLPLAISDHEHRRPISRFCVHLLAFASKGPSSRPPACARLHQSMSISTQPTHPTSLVNSNRVTTAHLTRFGSALLTRHTISHVFGPFSSVSRSFSEIHTLY